MQIVGHNFTKISGFKSQVSGKVNVNVDFQFLEIEKEKTNILRENNALKITFKHSANYQDTDKGEKNSGELLFEGFLLLSATEDESKEIMKSWKKKQLPQKTQVFLSNFLLRKCAPLALQLQSDLNLPSHIRIPALTSKE